MAFIDGTVVNVALPALQSDLLRAAGMGFDNLVKVTTIIPNPADIPASRPASTVIVAGLANPDWKIEIEAVAYA